MLATTADKQRKKVKRQTRETKQYVNTQQQSIQSCKVQNTILLKS